MKPLWSVTIPTYNSSKFLEETLMSVLEQNMDEDDMEIVVVDNCSTDDTINIVERLGKGRIKIVINEKNLGAIGNFNRCIEVAKGELIHLLNSDDVVNPDYYKEFEKAFANNNVSLVSCNSLVIDEISRPISITDTIDSLLYPSDNVKDLLAINKFRTPAVVVRKTAYNLVGNFDIELIHTADWEMWVRVIYNLKGLHINKVLCKYREHTNNASSKVMLTGENIIDTERLFKKFVLLDYPVDRKIQAKALIKSAKDLYTHYYLHNNTLGMQNLLTIYTRLAGKRRALELKIISYFLKIKNNYL